MTKKERFKEPRFADPRPSGDARAIVLEDMAGETRILVCPSDDEPLVLVRFSGRRARKLVASVLAKVTDAKSERN